MACPNERGRTSQEQKRRQSNLLLACLLIYSHDGSDYILCYLHESVYYVTKIEIKIDTRCPPINIQQIPCLFCRNWFIFNFITRHDRRRPREDGSLPDTHPQNWQSPSLAMFFQHKGTSNFYKYCCFVCFSVWHVHSRKNELRQNAKHVSWFDIQSMTSW